MNCVRGWCVGDHLNGLWTLVKDQSCNCSDLALLLTSKFVAIGSYDVMRW